MFEPPDVSLWGNAGVTAAIDISDGLSLDAWRLASASGVGLVLETPLPGIDALVDAGHRLSVDPIHWQLAGGDDYVRLVAADRSPGPSFTPIGRVEAGHPSLTLAMADGTSRALNPDGYRHDRGLLRSSEPEA
jgi:thiamine monophosphate kinase